MSGFPLNFNGTEYTDESFAGKKYTSAYPALLEDFVGSWTGRFSGRITTPKFMPRPRAVTFDGPKFRLWAPGMHLHFQKLVTGLDPSPSSFVLGVTAYDPASGRLSGRIVRLDAIEGRVSSGSSWEVGVVRDRLGFVPLLPTTSGGYGKAFDEDPAKPGSNIGLGSPVRSAEFLDDFDSDIYSSDGRWSVDLALGGSVSNKGEALPNYASSWGVLQANVTQADSRVGLSRPGVLRTVGPGTDQTPVLLSFKARVYIPALSTVPQRYLLQIGLSGNLSDKTDSLYGSTGIGFTYDSNVSSNWQLMRDGDSPYDTGIAVTTGWTNLSFFTVEGSAGGHSTLFGEVNGIQTIGLLQIATPNNYSFMLGEAMLLKKIVGVGQSSVVVDYIYSASRVKQ